MGPCHDRAVLWKVVAKIYRRCLHHCVSSYPKGDGSSLTEIEALSMRHAVGNTLLCLRAGWVGGKLGLTDDNLTFHQKLANSLGCSQTVADVAEAIAEDHK